VIHYCSDGDVIHRLVCEGFVKGRENVEFLPSHSNAGWIDHAAMSPTFTEVLKDEIANYLNR